MNKRKIGALLLAFVLLMSTMCSASAVMTTEEKSKLYQDAVRELETYLETSSSSGESLYGIRTTFELLDRFGQSQSLNYYTIVLIKLYEETYDYDMLSNLELLELDRRFQDYLNNEMKGSPLCSVEELKSYAEAREKEHGGDASGAMECYRNCMSFFDASKRYRALREAGDEQKYSQALAMQNAGDFAGAYFLFSDIVPYRDSDKRKQAIETMLGYTPASPSDNLQPVTGLTVKTAKETEITLSWKASAHAKTYEVEYRENNSESWINAGETKGTGWTVNGLKENSTYAFRVTAAIGKIKAEVVEITAKTAAKPTPTPKPTTTPISKPTPTPIPELPDGISTVGDFSVEKIAAGKVKILSYHGNASNLSIPEQIGGCSVISLRGFQYNTRLTSITIPNSVTSFDDRCFFRCASLESVTIPNSVTKLGNYCFSFCTSLRSVMILNGVKNLGKSCFSDCINLCSITIPNSITSLEDSCFFNCKSLRSITIPNGVTSLGSDCFNRCTSLTSITIPNSVTSIGNHCFANCTSLTSIVIPQSVKDIGGSAFYGISSKLTIEVTKGSYAEKYCKQNKLKYRSK